MWPFMTQKKKTETWNHLLLDLKQNILNKEIFFLFWIQKQSDIITVIICESSKFVAQNVQVTTKICKYLAASEHKSSW